MDRVLVVVIGGAGSGKSAIAEELAVSLREKRIHAEESPEECFLYYLATMWNDASDPETLRRIRRHREMRKDKGFVTVECPLRLREAVPAAREGRGAVCLLEDLPNLLANELWREGGALVDVLAQVDHGGTEAEQTINALTQAAAAAILEPLMTLAETGDLVVVTGAVSSDGVQYDPYTDAYLSLLNELGGRLAARAEQVVEAVCGIPVRIRG